jgi:hypothetical protein
MLPAEAFSENNVMTHCPQCRYEIRSHRDAALYCPKCGTQLPEAGETPAWTPIARVANLAEVGFLADVLEGHDIVTHIHHHNQFNAVDGAWHTSFALQVPQQHAASAAEILRRELKTGGVAEDAGHYENNDFEREDFESEEFESDDLYERPVSSGGMWKPVLVVLVAGGLAYWAGRSTPERPPVPPPRTDSLSRALSETDRPLVSDSAVDHPQRRLQYDAASHRVVLDEDLDGDGLFDRQRQFQDGELVRELVQ